MTLHCSHDQKRVDEQVQRLADMYSYAHPAEESRLYKTLKQTAAVALIVGLSMFLVWLVMPKEAQGAEVDSVVIETIAREAIGENLVAQIYVAKVIRQRAIERQQTYKQVCLAPYQFSCWLPNCKQKPRTAAELRTARRAWELSASITDRPNLYHDTSVSPKWARSNKVRFVRKIGTLRFYREERGQS